MITFYSKAVRFCIENVRLCTENVGFGVENVGFCRKRPEFLGVLISHRQRPQLRPRSPGAPQPRGVDGQQRYPQLPSASPSARRAPNSERQRNRSPVPDATPLRANQSSGGAPQSVPAKPGASGGLASRLWWAAAAAQQAGDDRLNLEALDEQEEDWASEIFYMGAGGDTEAEAFVASLRAAGELDPEQDGSNVKVKAFLRSAIKCAIPAETEYAVEVFIRPAGDSSNGNGSISKMRWSLLSSHYDAELEDLIDGAYDLSICPSEIPDWEDPTVQAAAASLHLSRTGEDWSTEDYAGKPSPDLSIAGMFY